MRRLSTQEKKYSPRSQIFRVHHLKQKSSTKILADLDLWLRRNKLTCEKETFMWYHNSLSYLSITSISKSEHCLDGCFDYVLITFKDFYIYCLFMNELYIQEWFVFFSFLEGLRNWINLKIYLIKQKMICWYTLL